MTHLMYKIIATSYARKLALDIQVLVLLLSAHERTHTVRHLSERRQTENIKMRAEYKMAPCFFHDNRSFGLFREAHEGTLQ